MRAYESAFVRARVHAHVHVCDCACSCAEVCDCYVWFDCYVWLAQQGHGLLPAPVSLALLCVRSSAQLPPHILCGRALRMFLAAAHKLVMHACLRAVCANILPPVAGCFGIVSRGPHSAVLAHITQRHRLVSIHGSTFEQALSFRTIGGRSHALHLHFTLCVHSGAGGLVVQFAGCYGHRQQHMWAQAFRVCCPPPENPTGALSHTGRPSLASRVSPLWPVAFARKTNVAGVASSATKPSFAACVVVMPAAAHVTERIVSDRHESAMSAGCSVVLPGWHSGGFNGR